MIGQLAQLVALILKLCLRMLAFADVDHGARDPLGFPMFVANDDATNAQPPPVPAAGVYPGVSREDFRALRLKGPSQSVAEYFPVPCVNGFERLNEEVGSLLQSALEKFQNTLGVADFFIAYIPVPDAFVGRAQRQLNAFAVDFITIDTNQTRFCHVSLIIGSDAATSRASSIFRGADLAA